MNVDDGRIRSLAPTEQPTPREIEINDAERRVLERYKIEYRPELLTRWRDGRLKLGAAGFLVDADAVYTRQQRRQEAREAAKKLRPRPHRARNRQ